MCLKCRKCSHIPKSISALDCLLTTLIPKHFPLCSWLVFVLDLDRPKQSQIYCNIDHTQIGGTFHTLPTSNFHDRPLEITHTGEVAGKGGVSLPVRLRQKERQKNADKGAKNNTLHLLALSHTLPELRGKERESVSAVCE